MTTCGGGGLVTKSCLTLVTPWTVARQAPLSMGFPRQEYWSGLPLPSPGDLPGPGIKPRCPTLQADSLPTELWGKPLYRKFYKMGGAFCLSQKVFPQTIFSKVVSTVILATSSFLASACVRSLFSHLQLFATPWTVAHQVPLSMGFSRQEHWSGLPFPSPNDNIGPHKKPVCDCSK